VCMATPTLVLGNNEAQYNKYIKSSLINICTKPLFYKKTKLKLLKILSKCK